MKYYKFFLPFLLLSGVMTISCDLFRNDNSSSTVYYKSYFLGENGFRLNGKISDINGQNLSPDIIGNNITAKVTQLDSDWEIKSSLNGNSFDFQINKTSDNGTVLSKNLSSDYGHTMQDYFLDFFNRSSIPDDDSKREIKIYGLSFGLDDGTGLNEWGFSKKVSFSGIDEHYYYVYVTEPTDISGRFHDGDSISYFECNFSQIGWYKLCNYYDHPIGKNPGNSSSTDIKLRTSPY